MDTSCRILIVEDNTDTADSLVLLLSLTHHWVTKAADGPSALKIAEETEVDVVLLDLGLPGMDGYEVARRLRKLGKPLYIIAITGYGEESARHQAVEAGVDKHLLKPADPAG